MMIDLLDFFISYLQKNKLLSVNKKRKDIERQIQQLHEKYIHLGRVCFIK